MTGLINSQFLQGCQLLLDHDSICQEKLPGFGHFFVVDMMILSWS